MTDETNKQTRLLCVLTMHKLCSMYGAHVISSLLSFYFVPPPHIPSMRTGTYVHIQQTNKHALRLNYIAARAAGGLLSRMKNMKRLFKDSGTEGVEMRGWQGAETFQELSYKDRERKKRAVRVLVGSAYILYDSKS